MQMQTVISSREAKVLTYANHFSLLTTHWTSAASHTERFTCRNKCSSRLDRRILFWLSLRKNPNLEKELLRMLEGENDDSNISVFFTRFSAKSFQSFKTSTAQLNSVTSSSVVNVSPANLCTTSASKLMWSSST